MATLSSLSKSWIKLTKVTLAAYAATVAAGCNKFKAVRQKGTAMTITKIARLLTNHGVPYKIVGERILADSMIGGTELFEITEDVTGWSLRKLLDWLGY